MRILLVSQMYPGPADPDLGVFVRGLEEQLVARGHEVERAVLDRRGGSKVKYLRLARATGAATRRFQPDVVYAHFLVPTGLIGALAGRAPLVVTAHGRDVRNVGWLPGIRAATRFVAHRAAAIIAVSAASWRRKCPKPAARPRWSTRASTSNASRCSLRLKARRTTSVSVH
jgi:Glycosyltransferase Family 4